MSMYSHHMGRCQQAASNEQLQARLDDLKPRVRTETMKEEQETAENKKRLLINAIIPLHSFILMVCPLSADGEGGIARRTSE